MPPLQLSAKQLHQRVLWDFPPSTTDYWNYFFCREDLGSEILTLRHYPIINPSDPALIICCNGFLSYISAQTSCTLMCSVQYYFYGNTIKQFASSLMSFQNWTVLRFVFNEIILRLLRSMLCAKCFLHATNKKTASSWFKYCWVGDVPISFSSDSGKSIKWLKWGGIGSQTVLFLF